MAAKKKHWMTATSCAPEERAAFLKEVIDTFQMKRAIARREDVDSYYTLFLLEQKEFIWKGAGTELATGYTLFSEFLTYNDVCKPASYERVKEAARRHTWDTLRTIGIDAGMQLLSIPEDAPSNATPSVPAVVAVEKAYSAFAAKHHTPPSLQHAKAMAREHYTRRPSPPKEKSDAQRANEAEARVKVLEGENEALRAENDSLRARLAVYEPPAKPGVRKAAPKKQRSLDQATV